MQTLRLLGLCMMVFGLAACTGKPVKTYEGEALSASEQALLIAGDNIEVKSINGKKMREYMLKNIETHYALKPGKNNVVFVHTSLWATNKRNSDAKSEVVESKPQYLEFDAQAGGTYTFEFDEADSREEARKVAETFTANLVTASGGFVAASAVYVPREPELNEVVGELANAGECVNPGPEISTLDAMKNQWSKASQDDRKAFLKWAFK